MDQPVEREIMFSEETGQITALPPTPVNVEAGIPEVAPMQIEGIMTIPAPIPQEAIERKSMLPLILEKIHDANFPLEEVNRLIAIEIALVTQEMSSANRLVHNGDHTQTFLQKNYDQQVKALTALEKSLTNTDLLRTRDVLNIDGPKFQWLFAKIVDSFKKAATDALGKDGEVIVVSIMKHWRDELSVSEAAWRTGVERIESNAKK